MTDRAATITGLRALADLLDGEETAKAPTYGPIIYHTVKTRAEMRDLVKRIGGRWDKKVSGNTFSLVKNLGGEVQYRVEVNREQVCKKRVVGRRPVQRMTPQPAYYASRMETVMEDVVEWDCPEMLG